MKTIRIDYSVAAKVSLLRKENKIRAFITSRRSNIVDSWDKGNISTSDFIQKYKKYNELIREFLVNEERG